MISADVHAELLQFYAHQAQAVDRGDGEAYAATFTPDGKIESGAYTVNGHDGFVAMAHHSYRNAAPGQNRHSPQQFSFEALGENKVKATYYSIVFFTDDSSNYRVKYIGLNVDILRNIHGIWKVAERRGVGDPLSRIADDKNE